MAAWVKRIRKDRAEQIKKERARYGEKAGSGITGRVLGPNGWEVCRSRINLRHVVNKRQRINDKIAALADVNVQASVALQMGEHEASVLRIDLEIFVLSMRWRQKNRSAIKWFNALSSDEQEAVILSAKKP